MNSVFKATKFIRYDNYEPECGEVIYPIIYYSELLQEYTSESGTGRLRFFTTLVIAKEHYYEEIPYTREVYYKNFGQQRCLDEVVSIIQDRLRGYENMEEFEEIVISTKSTSTWKLKKKENLIKNQE